jgi:hypothetical protein
MLIAIPVPALTRRAVAGYACAVLVLALIFGGGTRQGTLGDAIVELAALPLLVFNLITLRLADLAQGARLAVLLAGAIIALPILQLLPLPPTIWSLLPGRAPFALTYGSLGMPLPWLPISLDPAATWWSLLSLVPALSLFLTALRFTAREKQTLLKVIIPVVVCSVLLDGLQMMGGEDSRLRFFEMTNVDRAVGFFANSNHNATLLFSVLPFLVGMLTGGGDLFGSGRMARTAAAGIFAAVVVGLALTQSRAGLALGLLGTVLSAFVVYLTSSPGRRAKTLWYGLATFAAALLLVFQFGFLALSQRAENQELIQDLRWPVAAVTLKAASIFMPVGSGLGTFQPIYEMSAPRTLVRPAYVNHAHDDWLELWLEGGIPAALLLAAFLALYARLIGALFRSRNAVTETADGRMAWAAGITVPLILLHSTVDYPLRTIAVMAVFAIYVAVLATFSSRQKSTDGISNAVLAN